MATCKGSYGEGVPGKVRHLSKRVTGECPECGRRVSYVTLHALPLRPRGLGRHDAKQVKNDCTVQALSLALDVPYDTVAARLAQDGYRPGRRFNLDRWITCELSPAIPDALTTFSVFGYTATWVGCPAVKGQARHTPQSFAAAHPVGRYIVRQAHHVVAVKDGAVLMETRKASGGCVYGAWRFEPVAAGA